MAAAALTRPVNCALAALSVWVGALASGRAPAAPAVGLACLAAAAIAAAGNGCNDLADVEADRLNRPGRPLPSGRLQPRVAIVQTALLAVLGLALSFLVGPANGAVGAAVLAGLGLYSFGLKRSGLAGNLLVSALAAATFPFGALAAGGGGRWWVPAGFAALYHLGREMVKGAEDAAGDRVAGVRTLAVTRGPRAAARTAAALFAAVALTAPLPALLGPYGLGYAAPALALEVFLLVVIGRLWRGIEGAGSTSRLLLVGMVLGLLAVVLGEVMDRA